MQANVHTPQRLAGESQAKYGQRRNDSKAYAQAMTMTGPFTPKGECSRKQHRDAMRRSGSMKKAAGAYGRGLRNWINRTQAAKLA